MQDDKDTDLNHFNEINIPSKGATYINENDIKYFLNETQRFENISALHVSIRGPKPNFEHFCNLLNNTGSSFNIICLTETWCSNSEIINSSHFDINNYKAVAFENKANQRGGSILIYVKIDLIHKIIKDLSISENDKEKLITEIIIKESNNMLLSSCYRLPKGITENLTAYLTSVF